MAGELLDRHSEIAEDLETASEGDSEMASVVDLEMGSAVGSVLEALVFVTASGSASFLDSVLVSADAGDASASAGVGVGTHGGDGATRTIHTRIGEVMVTAGTMTRGRTVQT